MTSTQQVLTFSVNQLEDEFVTILSLFNDKFLVGCSIHLSQLFIYSLEGCHLATITVNDNDKLRDAIWTPRGNIVLTTCNSNKVIVTSESGKVIIRHAQMIGPRFLSVSNDDIMYLADKTGVYQSRDDGISWNLVFKSTNEWNCWQVVKVINDHHDDYWTVEKSGNNYHLRVYSLDRCSHAKVTWRDIDVTTSGVEHIDLSVSSLSYDGNVNIFLSDLDNKAVYAFSVNGHYQCKLLSSHQEHAV